MTNILIMEDDIDLSNDIRAMLEKTGFSVFEARNATRALEIIDKVPIDLVIADIFVKENGALVQDGGIRLISMIRQILAKSTPIIAVSSGFTGINGSEMKSAAATVGAKRTLAKPVAPETLKAAVLEFVQPGSSDGG